MDKNIPSRSIYLVYNCQDHFVVTEGYGKSLKTGVYTTKTKSILPCQTFESTLGILRAVFWLKVC